MAAANLTVRPEPDLSVSLAAICSYWKEFNLDSRRIKLDEIGLQIAEYQEASTANRRKLADATRDFKRSSQSESSSSSTKAVGALLRQYQEEIDALTKRAKFGEGAFLELYQQLYEAPDPASSLVAALESEGQLAQLQAQVRKLSVELSEYKAESKAIKNQDLTLRKQEETIRELTAALEAKDQELEAARLQAAAEADAAVVSRMQEKEKELAGALESAQASLAAMQRLYTAAQNQLFELQSKSEEAAAGKQVEWELAAEELERAQERLAALEAEKAALKGKVEGRVAASAAPGSAAAAAAAMGTLEDMLRQDLALQRETNARLRQEVASCRYALTEAEEVWGNKMEALQEAVGAAEQQAQRLETELAARPTAAQVEELKQQVRALQAVGYGTYEADLATTSSTTGHGAAAAAGGGVGGAAAGGSMTLEGMLLAKTRKLEHELTMAKLQVAESKQHLEAAQAQVADLEAKASDQEQLIHQLEEDLRAAAGSAAVAAAATGIAGIPTSTAASGGRDGAGSGSGEGLVPDQVGAEGSMVRVLAGQRDRLRTRVREVEEQLAATAAQLQEVQGQLEAAKADNIALVERLRYVGGYRQQTASRVLAAAANGSGGGGAEGVDVESGRSAEVVGRYTRMYEDGINPFKEFQGQQRQQKKNQMGVADKAMYSMGNMVFQSPAARLVALCYLVLLHLLVFSSLTHMTHHSSQHLMDHHELMLTQRHDLTSMLHHDLAVVGGSGSGTGGSGSSDGGALAGSGSSSIGPGPAAAKAAAVGGAVGAGVRLLLRMFL